MVSNLWGSQGEDLAGDSEMHCEVGSSINTSHPADMLVGPSEDQIWTSAAVFVLAVEEQVHKLYTTIALIALVKYNTSFSRELAAGSQIHSLPSVASIL